jgi:hypothetical protein
MPTPIEQAMDAVDWTPVDGALANAGADLPYATHAGLLKIGALELRCYRLNTGMAVFDADDVKRFFGMEAGQ